MRLETLIVCMLVAGCASESKKHGPDAMVRQAPQSIAQPGNYNRLHIYVRPCDAPESAKSIDAFARWAMAATGYQFVSARWLTHRPISTLGGGCGMRTVQDALLDAIGSSNRIVVDIQRSGGRVTVERLEHGQVDRVVYRSLGD